MRFLGRLLLGLLKLPFILIAFALAMVFAITGIAVSLLGLSLVPAFGVGLLILPFGLVLLLVANWLRRLA
jgi:hypothetical protein